MSKHDYSQDTVSNVSSTIINCKNAIENTVLSTESMSYSWDSDIIHNVVTWFEVLQINVEKTQLEQLFQKADSKFNNVVQRVGQVDSSASDSLNDGETSLKSLKEKFSSIQEYSVQSVSVVGAFDNLHSILFSISEKYNNIDFDKLSEEEKREYFNRLNDIPDDQLTEEDKAKIQKYIDYLKDKFVVDGNLSEEEKRFIALYEKIHPDERDATNKFFDNSSKGGITENDKFNIKYNIYSMGIPYQLAEKLCDLKNKYSSCDNFKNQLDNFDGEPMVDQGNFHICDIKLEKNKDGSCNFSFTAKQSDIAKSYGAAIVYDKDGNVVSVDILDRYKNPTGFVDSISSIYNEIVNGGDFQETKVSCKIPKGGYIEITDDPNNIALLQVGKYVDEEIKSEIEDKIKGVVTDPIEESLKNSGKHATTQATSASSALYNANVAYKTVKTTAEAVDKLETMFWTDQQKGSGSWILYN